MKLLKELNEEIEYLTETIDGQRQFYIEGIFLQGNIKNRNGRLYPINVLEEEVSRYRDNYINKRRAYGELNHPTSPSINLDKVSHIITELNRENSNFVGKAKILTNTPNGKIVQALMEEGCVLGVSSRGLGSLKEKNGAKYVENLYLTTAADIVADPSAPDAFVDNVMENIEWFFDGANWIKQEKAYDFVNEMKQTSKKKREEQFLELFQKLFSD